MELNRFAVQHNEVVGLYNALLARYQALRADNARLRRELTEASAEASEWRRSAYRGEVVG